MKIYWKTILDWIRYATSQLRAEPEIYYGHGTDNALDEATALVLGLLHLPYNLDRSYFAAEVSHEEQDRLWDGLRQRLKKRRPVPYITKSAYFGGLEFYIDERALIPRSPLAEVLERPGADYGRILDLCCGSGCLGILAKYHHPEAEVVLADCSADALEVARINVKRFRLGDEVALVRGDLFENIQGRFDLIICNPPYVEDAEAEEVPAEFKHEPANALYAGADGLDLVRRILREAPDYLSDDGLLLLEVGASADNLVAAYPDCDFDWLELERGGGGICAITADELHAWHLAGLLD